MRRLSVDNAQYSGYGAAEFLHVARMLIYYYTVAIDTSELANPPLNLAGSTLLPPLAREYVRFISRRSFKVHFWKSVYAHGYIILYYIILDEIHVNLLRPSDMLTSLHWPSFAMKFVKCYFGEKQRSTRMPCTVRSDYARYREHVERLTNIPATAIPRAKTVGRENVRKRSSAEWILCVLRGVRANEVQLLSELFSTDRIGYCVGIIIIIKKKPAKNVIFN